MENGYLIVQIKLTNHTDLDTKPLPTKLKETLKRKTYCINFQVFPFLETNILTLHNSEFINNPY